MLRIIIVSLSALSAVSFACTNFAGTWRGTCSDVFNGADHKYQDKIVIEQTGCTHITIDGIGFDLPGRTYTTTTQGTRIYDKIEYAMWKDANQDILEQLMYRTEWHSDNMLWNTHTSTSFTVDKGHLTVQGAGFLGNDQMSKVTAGMTNDLSHSCDYQKASE